MVWEAWVRSGMEGRVEGGVMVGEMRVVRFTVLVVAYMFSSREVDMTSSMRGIWMLLPDPKFACDFGAWIVGCGACNLRTESWR